MEANLPTWQHYAGANALQFNAGSGAVWFSYKTPVAFRTSRLLPKMVRQNDWGVTTGKHLNAIDGGNKAAKADRLPSDEFERLLREAIA